MKVSLLADRRKIVKYLRQRIADYPVYVNHGPGRDEDAIRQITLGYYLEQTGYLVVVFDTRPDADCDGQWTGYIDDDTNRIVFPKWPKMIDCWYNRKPFEIVGRNGRTSKVNRRNYTHQTLAELVGETIRDAMLEIRDNGGLCDLPLADGAFLIVQEFNGHWEWPTTYVPHSGEPLAQRLN